MAAPERQNGRDEDHQAAQARRPPARESLSQIVRAELALAIVPGDGFEGVDDEGDNLVVGRRSEFIEPSE